MRGWPGPPSTGSCDSPVPGPFAMIFSPYQVPAPNTVKYTTTKIASVSATGPAPCGDTASLVRISPYTIQGWRPISVVIQPARIATSPAGPIHCA